MKPPAPGACQIREDDLDDDEDPETPEQESAAEEAARKAREAPMKEHEARLKEMDQFLRQTADTMIMYTAELVRNDIDYDSLMADSAGRGRASQVRQPGRHAAPVTAPGIKSKPSVFAPKRWSEMSRSKLSSEKVASAWATSAASSSGHSASAIRSTVRAKLQRCVSG